MIAAALALLRPFLGVLLTQMIRALILNLRVERGTDPALLQEVQRAVREAALRTDLGWDGKLELVSDRVMAWSHELGKDVYRATVNTLAHLELQRIWAEAQRR